MNLGNAVWECLEKAIDRFNKSDDPQSLLCPRCENPRSVSDSAAANERAIGYRLAFYLESELRTIGLISDFGPLVVDCEYNRHLAKKKTLASETEDRIKDIVKKARDRTLEADEDGSYVFSIAPDILVHQRRTDVNNLLVVEVKKRTNPETEEYDHLKLELFTKSRQDDMGYGYRYGAWIVAEDKCPPEKRALKLLAQYQNGKNNIQAQ